MLAATARRIAIIRRIQSLARDRKSIQGNGAKIRLFYDGLLMRNSSNSWIFSKAFTATFSKKNETKRRDENKGKVDKGWQVLKK
jgi:hypothetical protein